MIRLTLAALMLVPALARAETPMSPAEFEDFALNRTLIWSLDGVEFGIERYAPGRRVIWADTGGACQGGGWQAEGDEICFLYDDDPKGAPVCWRFAHDGDTVVADQTRVEEPVRLTVTSVDGALLCPGYGS